MAVGAPVREAPDGAGLEVAHAGLRVALRGVPAVARFFAEPHASGPPSALNASRPGRARCSPRGRW